MLGILCFNEHCDKNKITHEIINISGVDFFEIELNLKREIKDKSSKKHIKKAFKVLKKADITQICAKHVFDDYMGKINYHPHNFIWNIKQNEIILMLTQKADSICIFGENIDKKTEDFLEFCAKKFDNIYVDFEKNTEKVCQHLLKNYGISAIKLDVNYDLKQKTVVCFAVPKKVLPNKILINFTNKSIEQKNMYDIECDIGNYTKNTDITAIANYLCIKNKDNAKDVKIKNILTKT